MTREPYESGNLIHLQLLGSLRLKRNQMPINLPTRKIDSLFAFLVLHPEPHRREKLAALPWGDVSDEQARGSLRKALTLLRAALGKEILLADRQTVQVNPDYPLQTDIREFEQATMAQEWGSLSAMQSTFQQIETLYRGDLLADLYDDWIFPLREALRECCIKTLLALTQGFRSQSEYARAIVCARRVLALDPANEHAHRHIMFCNLGLGDRQAALKQYTDCVRALEQELGVHPSSETEALLQWIQQFSAERSPGLALISNLPIPLSSFVGRQLETIALKQYLTVTHRLVTLVGPGGSGKTRLAIQTATDLIDTFPDGVWWVELAAITDPANVIHQIAKALGVRESPPDSLQTTVRAFLENKQLLLILDNCEHVLETSAYLTNELLLSCPRLRVLATSRQALRIAGEQVYPVPALTVPRRDAWSYTDLLREFEGVRLFVERAQSVQPAFELTEQNASAVAQICARLDGIPLALELAASRVNILTVHEIASRLDARFDFLKDANRVAPPRHQTLRAVLDWSCELLLENERALFRRLSVFADGSTLDALDAVAAGADIDSVFDTLASLIEKSLVFSSPRNGITRYGMLETIQHYAGDMLNASGETNLRRDLQLQYFVQFCEQSEAHLRGSAQAEWLAQLEIELENIRTALEWSVTRDPASGLQIAGSLEWYWNLRGHWREGAAWIQRLLDAAPASTPPPIRARVLVSSANLSFWSGMDKPLALTRLEQAINLYLSEPTPPLWGLAYALSQYGEVLREAGQEPRARSALDEALHISNLLGQPGKWIAAWAHMGLGGLYDVPAIRQTHYEQAAELFRDLGDNAQLPVVLARCAWFYMAQHQFSIAHERAHESLELTKKIGDSLGLAWHYKLLGDLAFAQGQKSQANESYQTALEHFRRIGSSDGAQTAEQALALTQ